MPRPRKMYYTVVAPNDYIVEVATLLHTHGCTVDELTALKRLRIWSGFIPSSAIPTFADDLSKATQSQADYTLYTKGGK